MSPTPAVTSEANLPAEVTYLLETLGSTHEEIAESLTRMGCQGEFKETHCPIARFLRRHYSGRNILVSRYAVMIDDLSIRLPAPVMRFVVRFDNLHYPNLVFSNKEPPPS